MTNLINIELTTLKSTELKALAKEFHVKNWWLLNKTNLVSELTEIKQEQEDQEAVKRANEEFNKGLKGESKKEDKNQENLITLKDLADEFNMRGGKVRRLLRNAAISRPYGGNRWEWDKELHWEELKAAREFLKKYAK